MILETGSVPVIAEQTASQGLASFRFGPDSSQETQKGPLKELFPEKNNEGFTGVVQLIAPW